ncbi:MAG: BACON domain-containing protein [Prevotellaceae bacterium]|nr:BACON domain-containing protein [Prevotellaceae bacterium]
MKYTINLFLITAIISIAMFTACKDKDSDSSSLTVDQTEIDVPAIGGITLINVSTGLSWNASADADWVALSTTSGNGAGTVTVTVADRGVGGRRTATVTFVAGSITQTVNVLQRSKLESDYYRTGDVIRLNRHTEGEGIAIVFIGDGFDQEDCKKGGFYEEEVTKLSDLFLSMPVIRDFKSYFDVYARVDVSRERGVRNCVANPERCPNNVYLSGHPQIDFGKASDNARLTAGKDDYWFIFIGNGMIGGYAMGNFAIYSANEGLKPYWMMHEFAGHAFGGFPDLYYIWGSDLLNDADKKMFDDNHEAGELLMYDWRNDPQQVYWKDFIGKNGYEMVGIHKGGYAYFDRMIKFGECFCCEDVGTDVMFGPTAHYSVMERYQLWRKIQQRSGSTIITIDEFLKYDVVNLIDSDWSWDRYNHWMDDRVWTSEDDYFYEHELPTGYQE